MCNRQFAFMPCSVLKRDNSIVNPECDSSDIECFGYASSFHSETFPVSSLSHKATADLDNLNFLAQAPVFTTTTQVPLPAVTTAAQGATAQVHLSDQSISQGRHAIMLLPGHVTTSGESVVPTTTATTAAEAQVGQRFSVRLVVELSYVSELF